MAQTMDLSLTNWFGGAPTYTIFVFSGLSICIFLIANFTKRIWVSRDSTQVQTPIPTNEQKKVASTDYSHVFPPSRRESLSQIDGFPASLASARPRDVEFRSNLVRLEEDYRLATPSKVLFTGFRVEDVLKLGRFPDYATLSGVPLPAPVGKFDINKAVARPYRPFRWAYHQTMCKSQVFHSSTLQR